MAIAVVSVATPSGPCAGSVASSWGRRFETSPPSAPTLGNPGEHAGLAGRWKPVPGDSQAAVRRPELASAAGGLGHERRELRPVRDRERDVGATAAGVPQDELIATDTTAMATAIASGQRPGPPPKPEVDLGQGIDALSGALGISSSDLLERLTSGAGISGLLAVNPEVSASLAEMQNRGALVDGYC